MPIYEFRCNGCGARVSIFFRSMNEEVKGTCERCGSADLHRLMSRFNMGRPPLNPDSLNKSAMLDGVDYSDPGSMANFFRRMGQEFQDEPNEVMDEIIGRLDHGDPVEHALGLDAPHDHDHGPSPEVGNDAGE